jgi:hypothetical protein
VTETLIDEHGGSVKSLTPDQAATALRYMKHAMPHDLSMIVSVVAAKINENGALSDRCRKSVIEQLDEISDEIDADYEKQKAES